jgi:hypothetical protein
MKICVYAGGKQCNFLSPYLSKPISFLNDAGRAWQAVIEGPYSARHDGGIVFKVPHSPV